MVLHRISILTILLLSVGGVVVLTHPNLLFPPTVAQNSSEPRRPKQGHNNLMDQLNLSQEQKQKLQAIRSQYKDQISQNKQALRQATQELKNLMAAGDTPSDTIRAKHKQVQDLRDQVEKVSFESTMATREVLTPVQRSQWAQLMEQRRGNAHKQMEQPRGSQP